MHDLFSTRGRLNRSQYLLHLIGLFTAAYILFSLGSTICNNLHLDNDSGSSVEGFLSILLFFALMTLGVCTNAKRCHDLNKSGWWQLVPFYGIAMLFCPGIDPNNYNIKNEEYDFGNLSNNQNIYQSTNSTVQTVTHKTPTIAESDTYISYKQGKYDGNHNKKLNNGEDY